MITAKVPFKGSVIEIMFTINNNKILYNAVTPIIDFLYSQATN